MPQREELTGTLFFLLCLPRAGFTIPGKAEAGSCRLPGSREELCLAADPGDLFKAKGDFLSHPNLVRRERWCSAPKVRGWGSPGCCTACGQIFCWAGAAHTGNAMGLFTSAEPPVSSLSNCSSCRQKLSDRAQLLLFLGAVKRPKHLNLWRNNFPCGYILMSKIWCYNVNESWWKGAAGQGGRNLKMLTFISMKNWIQKEQPGNWFCREDFSSGSCRLFPLQCISAVWGQSKTMANYNNLTWLQNSPRLFNFFFLTIMTEQPEGDFFILQPGIWSNCSSCSTDRIHRADEFASLWLHAYSR